MATTAVGVQTPYRGRGGIVSWPKKSWDFIRRYPVIPGAILSGLIFMAVFAPVLAPMDPVETRLSESLAPPFWQGEYYEANPDVDTHILGADRFGRDILSRVMHGARISLMIATISMVSGVILGAWGGVIAGYYGGFLDEVLSRFVDIWNALPFLLVALVVSITIGNGIPIMIGLLVALTWVGLVRNVRAEVFSLKTLDYVAAARIAGASDFRIMVKHIMPGVMNLLFVMASLRVGSLILTEAALSFLGVGIPSHIPTWGLMINDSFDTLQVAWWASVFPGLGIFLTVMSFNFLGDWIRDRTDPRLRQTK